MKASFLFNILGTIADNLRALIELTPTLKNKSIKLLFETKDSKHLVETSGDDSSALHTGRPESAEASHFDGGNCHCHIRNLLGA